MKELRDISRKCRSQYRYFVVCIAKDDGREGQGYYCKTIEEAEETKARMEQTLGAQLWDTDIREIKK